MPEGAEVGRSVIVAITVAALCGGCTDRSTSPEDSPPGSPAIAAMPAALDCSVSCELTSSPWALVSAGDSSDSGRVLASFVIEGTPGEAVELAMDASPAVRALVSTLPLSMVVDGRNRRIAWPVQGGTVRALTLDAGTRSATVALVLDPARGNTVPAGPFVLSLRTSGARIRRLASPYMQPPSQLPAHAIGDADCAAPVEIPGPGTYCETLVGVTPYVAGAGPFGGWQSSAGTGVSSPIVITFSTQVTFVEVTAIDPNFEGNRMEAYDQQGVLVASASFPGDGTPGRRPPTRVSASVAGNGIRQVVLIPAPGEYIAYEGLRAQGVPSPIALSCTPVTVVRGGTVTCMAGSLGTREVAGWGFVGGPQRTLIAQATTRSATWSGALVASGRVTVYATRAGGGTDSASATVRASRRVWTGQLAQFAVEEVPQGQSGRIVNELPAQPRRPGELGHTHHEAAGVEIVSSLDGSVRAAQVTGGPNDGLYYLTAVPWTAVAVIHVNRIALAIGSGFFNLQSPLSSGGLCGQPDVVPFLPIVEVHEGLRFDANSHTQLYRDGFSARAGQDVESVVSASEDALIVDAELALRRATSDALRESARADRPPLAPVYCTFRY